MSAIKNYFLIVRDRETNHFKIIDFNNSKGNLLEEIDNYTSDFRDAKSLIKDIQQKGYNVSEKTDIYIVQRKKENGHYNIKTQEVLYETPFLKKIIGDSLAGYYDQDSKSGTKEEKEKAKKTASILLMIIFRALKAKDENNNVIKTYKDRINFAINDSHFPEKFRDYLSNTPYYEKYDVKKLPDWQFRYYPLLRNLLPYISRDTKLDNPQARRMYERDLLGRMEIEDEIIKKTDKNYDSNQYNLFDDQYLDDDTLGDNNHVKRK